MRRPRVNPYGENYYDGISLTPFEVMFVKVGLTAVACRLFSSRTQYQNLCEALCEAGRQIHKLQPGWDAT